MLVWQCIESLNFMNLPSIDDTFTTKPGCETSTQHDQIVRRREHVQRNMEQQQVTDLFLRLALVQQRREVLDEQEGRHRVHRVHLGKLNRRNLSRANAEARAR